MLALVLAMSALSAAGASAARTTGASAWRLHSTLPRCAHRCSLERRLFGARVRRFETTSMRRHGVASRAAGTARPGVAAGGLEGNVTDAKTKTGLTGVEVCAYELKALQEGAYEEELEPECGSVLESSGRYQLGLAPGEYVVEFFDPARNYVTQLYKGRSLAEEPDAVKVKAGVFTPKIDAALAEGGRIEGTLTAAKGGAPLEGFVACALDFEVGGVDCAETGSGGKYRVTGLPAGSYEVTFLVPPLPGDNYLDAPLTGVKVTLAATTTGANAALPAGGEIEGTVTAAEGGAPLEKVLVCAFLANGEEVEECVHTRADGTYTVERLPTGSYDVEFFDEPGYLTQFYAGAPHLAGAKSISVTAGATTASINAKMISAAGHSGSIEGHVTSAATGASLGAVQVCALAPPHELVKCTLSEADGDYRLEGLPEGSYKIEFEDQPDYAAQFFAGKATLAEATLVPVTVGATAGGIDAAMVPTGIHQEDGSIEGRVTAEATGLPLGGAVVCAVAAPDQCALTEPDGTYALANLPEGDYEVEFNAGPRFVVQFYREASSISAAIPVHVVDGGRSTGIDAKLKAVVPAQQLPSGSQTLTGTGTSTTPQPGGGVLPAKAVVPSVTAAGGVRVYGRRASVKLHCAIGPCHGTVQLTITVTRRTRSHGRTVTRRVALVVGRGSFSLAQGASGSVTVRLSAQGARLLAGAARHPRAGKLKLEPQGASSSLRAVVLA